MENVPNIVLERAFAGRLSGKPKTIVSTLEELLVYVPPQMLVRKHSSGDFCVVLPLSKWLSSFPSSSFDGSTHPCGLSPDFSAEKQEIFVPLRPSPHSQDYVEVVSPFPGEGPNIDPCCYPPFRLTYGETDLLFPSAAKSHEDDNEDGDDSDGHTPVELRGVMKGDPGAAVTPGTLSVGDVLIVRGHLFKVCAVTGGGMPCEIYGGSDLIVFDRKFDFNARKVVARRCLQVIIQAKHDFLPRSALTPHEPVSIQCVSTGMDKKFGMGSFSMEFSTLSFNTNLVCHRDSFLPEHI